MWIEDACALSSALIVYHHIGYPLALRSLARRCENRAGPPPGRIGGATPPLTMIVPAYNEARFIKAKIRNTATLTYPRDRLSVVIVCDGCDDATAELARAAIHDLGEAGARFSLIVHEVNRGKIAILNETIANQTSDVIALSDTSAMLSTDALELGARHFNNKSVGFVSGSYQVGVSDPRQVNYWNYQGAIKRAEGALDSPVGAHGAFYLFRREAWSPLAADTINDDVMLPMKIVEAGYRGVYDPAIGIAESDRDTFQIDLSRRARLSAGAIQQALRLWRLADPRRPGLAFSFLSGKALRAFMPFVMLFALISNIVLARSSEAWTILLIGQIIGYGAGVIGLLSARAARLPFTGQMSYLLAGHAIGLVGAVRYLGRSRVEPWTRARKADTCGDDTAFLHRGAVVGKRALDIAIALIALVALAILFAPIALAIKLESRGPIFYRQLRVGLRTSKCSRLFYLSKFRTMRADAEVASGAVWATEHDPRVTRVGRFMRKTRLDELPQCLDVLRGDMSIVGPRPERPQFFDKLENAIPFYAERTYGLKPGITGLAQVTLPYDSCIEDVRAKVLHDHAYALQLSAPGRWLMTDLSIILRTFTVMVLGKGR